MVYGTGRKKIKSKTVRIVKDNSGFHVAVLFLRADKYDCLFITIYGFFFISSYYAEAIADKVKIQYEEDLCNLTEHLIRVVKSINRSAATQNRLNQQLCKEIKSLKKEIKELKEENKNG